MIVSKILILFLPLLLLAEANFGNGPFHRSPSTSIPNGSPTISSNLPVNQRIPSPPKLPHNDQQTPPSVHVVPATLVYTEKSVSVEPATLPPKINTNSPIEIQTPKPGLVQSPNPFHINNINWVNGINHVPKPVSSPWTPPKFDTVPSVNIHRASQPNALQFGHASYVYQTPPTVSSVPTDKTLVQDVYVHPSSDRKKFSRDELLKIQHPEHHNFIPRLAPSPRIPNKPSTNSSEEILSASQPICTDKGNHKEIGPYQRSQRSADPWDQDTWDSSEEDQISQNDNPPPALTTERPGSNLRRFKCQQAYGYFKYTNQCGEYIECKNYIPLAYTCPLGLYFNPRANWTEYPCDHPSNVQCDKETIPLPTTASPPTTTLPPKVVTTPRPNNQKNNYRCPQPHGYFKFSDQCEQYIECKNYVALMFSCPTGLHFNPRVEWTAYPCEHPSIVQCDSEPNDEKTPRPIEAPTTTAVPPTPFTRPPTPTTRRPPPPPIAWRPRTPTTRQPPPPPPITRSPPPPPPPTWRPRPPTTRPPPPPPPTTRSPPPPPTTSPVPVITPGPKNPPDYNICLQQFGYFRFSDQCGEYIECKQYVPLIFTCPAGLHFNPLADWTEYPCDHPSKVQCNEEFVDHDPFARPPIRTPRPTIATSRRPTEPVITSLPRQLTPKPPSKQPFNYSCPESNGFYSVASQCDAYVECKDSIPMERTCPAGLLFNRNAHWPDYPCGYPSEVTCSSGDVVHDPFARPPIRTPRPTNATSRRPTKPVITSLPRQLTPKPPSKEPFNYSCPESNGFYSVASQCDAYVECKDSIPMERTCPAGLLFNRNAHWPDYPCGYPSEVTCSSGDVVHDPFARPPIRTPRPTNATSRRPTKPVINSLPRQLTPKPPSKEPFNYSCPESNGFYSVASQCDAYVECKDSIPMERTCPAGLLFNRNAHWPDYPCGYPSEVTCSSGDVVHDPFARPPIRTPRPTNATSRRPTKPVITSLPRQLTPKPPSKEPFNYSCPESNGFYSVASQCDAYVECKDSIPMERTCPAGLLFNRNAHWPDYPCGYPSEVTCSSGDVVQQPDPTAECPNREGFFPTDNGDCGEYIVCHAGVATIEHCPPGLVFNFDKLNTCDWPINVPACNQARELEGFVCPSKPENENALHIHNYRYGRSCTNFIACQMGHPRLLACDAGLHFNEETESCVDSDLVMDCDV